MTVEDWKDGWPYGHLMQSVDRPELPPGARDFVRDYSLPAVMIFEADGDNASMSFEWHFSPLSSPLMAYTKMFSWGDFYDAELYRLWSRQLAIGAEDFCNGSASICVHQFEGYVARLDCELSGKRRLGMFVNSSLPQFGESMLAAVRWSIGNRTVVKQERTAAFAEFLDALARIDRAAIVGAEGLMAFWPTLLDSFDPGEPLSRFDITSDPRRSRSRF